ncbi:MAG: hypothetical protein R6U27_03735 [Desulfobacterales bacterium]
MGSVFLFAVGFLFADIVCGVGFLFQKAEIRIQTMGMLCGLVFIFLAHVQGFRAPTIENYEVVIDRLPSDLDGTTIVVMSDLHLGEIMVGSGWLNARIDQVHADCIVLAGDLFERSSDPTELIPVMRPLSAPMGV